MYPRLLERLRTFRLLAKDAGRKAPAEKRDFFEALQSSFKILINSFYGYAGFSRGTFNDYDLAETVTREGREILRSMVEFLQQQHATIIEIDTDGIYFVPPAGVTDQNEMQRRIQEILPEGIDIDLDGTYEAMLGYKAKNYALLGHDGTISITGAALKSRGLEPFQREYIREMVTLLLHGRGDEAGDLYERYLAAIREHRFPLASFAKREVLSTSPKVYAEKMAAGTARRSAAYELALAAKREYKQGDTILFYVTGNKKSVAVADAAKLLSEAEDGLRDENIPYYSDKLTKLHQKFKAFWQSATPA